MAIFQYRRITGLFIIGKNLISPITFLCYHIMLVGCNILLRHPKPKAGVVVTPSAAFPLRLMMPLTKHVTGEGIT